MVFHLGSSCAAPGENVGDDAHGGTHGVDVGAAGDVFLENVVLHGAGDSCEIGALFFGDGDVEARRIAAVELMVMEVETFSSGMPSKRVSMSSSESMATPTLPTSPSASG